MQILALDVGTSSVKAAVLDVATARPVGTVAHAPYELESPTPDAAEVSPERLWTAVTAAAREATLQAPEVEAIGVSCMTPALVLVGKDQKPLAPIWTHLDRRARGPARQTWQAVGAEFLSTTGNRPLPGGISAVCYRQQLETEPYLMQKVRHYLHVNGWLALHLTGEAVFDPSNASFSGLYNTMTDRQWSQRWCDYFEIERDWLPPVVDGRTVVGTVRSAVAGELGVPAGIPLRLGVADTSSAMLAAGMRSGDLLHEVGTTQVLAALTPNPQPSALRLTRLLGVGADFVHVTHNPVGGAALEWIHKLCFRDQDEKRFYERTIPEAQALKTRVTLDPAYLGGDRLEIESHRAAFRDLTVTTDRLELLAALLTAMVQQHRKALANLGVGERFARIFLAGGGAEVVHRLLPEYATAEVRTIEEGSLFGVARLFQ
ncbi:MAG TPA: FGGY-family carbohydrate kinase [Gemmataceae bacterium]|nr:FGGY-family carbohydrate kinase [Gemmataceae bacterium]